MSAAVERQSTAIRP